MDKLDEYYFIVMAAITEPSGSDKFYFYNKGQDELFRLGYQAGYYYPLYRNRMTEMNDEVAKKLMEGASMVQNNATSIIQLPRLIFREKKDFLTAYLSNITDEKLKAKLEMDVNSFSERDVFNYKTNLKALDSKLYLKWDMDLGRFIAEKTREIYGPMGITEKSKVIW
jgi:hypothetical protein